MQRYLVEGLRPGTRIHVEGQGFFVNGTALAPERAKALTAHFEKTGMPFRRYDGPDVSAEAKEAAELEERNAAQQAVRDAADKAAAEKAEADAKKAAGGK